MINRLLYRLVLFFVKYPKILSTFVFLFIISLVLGFIANNAYENWDDDPDRGAIGIENGALGESYSKPFYLEQGWSESDSLWFYNTTQGSDLLPYDFFLVLEQAGNKNLFLADHNIDKYRFLPQKVTLSNREALPVGMVKDTYKGKDYIGFTCAACHTGQINYQDEAIRIDGAPTMADLSGFLLALEYSLKCSLLDDDKKELELSDDDRDKCAKSNDDKNKRFVDNVLNLDNDYSTASEVNKGLRKWAGRISLYNAVNDSITAKGKKLEYGYARLDAFGRIYNRVLEHILNKKQIGDLLAQIGTRNCIVGHTECKRLINDTQIENVLKGMNETIVDDDEFFTILTRLQKPAPDYPGFGIKSDGMYRVRNAIFNSPNAPVSYPFLWDIPQSTYVQWNGLASNAGIGPLGRNVGEVIGVFANIDWKVKKPGWTLASLLSGQKNKAKQIEFESSVDLFNLQKIESHLSTLLSPEWPAKKFGCKEESGKPNKNPWCEEKEKEKDEDKPSQPWCIDNENDANPWCIDKVKADQGKITYAKHCQSCHEVIDRTAYDRLVISKMTGLVEIGTDPQMANNSVNFMGKAGNFKHTYQKLDVGSVVIEEDAPVIQLLTAATTGTVATPDPDKWFLHRWADWLYILYLSYTGNEIKSSIKSGDYLVDTTSDPYNSLLSYKARSLNGIWATAPYLHNGSVPTLYDLLLPAEKCKTELPITKFRPVKFKVGLREFDTKKVGFISDGEQGFTFDTSKPGNRNVGHEYGACETNLPDGKVLYALSDEERWQLVEYLKTL